MIPNLLLLSRRLSERTGRPTSVGPRVPRTSAGTARESIDGMLYVGITPASHHHRAA